MKSNKKFHHNTYSAFFVLEQLNQLNQQSKNHSNQINQNQNQNSFFRNRNDFRDRDRKKMIQMFYFKKNNKFLNAYAKNFIFMLIAIISILSNVQSIKLLISKKSNESSKS